MTQPIQPGDAKVSAVLVPVVPSDGVLMSIALRLDHALGMPGFYDDPMVGGKPGDHARRLELALADARRAYEEVVGQGFYSPERERFYRSMKEAATTVGDIRSPEK